MMLTMLAMLSGDTDPLLTCLLT